MDPSHLPPPAAYTRAPMQRFRRALTGLLTAAALVTSATCAPAARADDVVRSPGIPSYDVSLRTGATGRTWRGSERITFTNLESAPLSRIWLRLWSNGVVGCRRQAITVGAFEGGAPGDLSRGCTALPVDLDAPLGPGQTATISMRLVIRLPSVNDRFGYHKGLALLGTALPTLAVHDDAGWHLPPYTDFGESFYSIAGDYLVRLDAPAGLDTPASGAATDRREHAGRIVTTYEADDVRDFAWAAGHLRKAVGRSGAARVVTWYDPSSIGDRRARAASLSAVTAMDSFSGSFGSFPYPELDVVLTAFTTFGGMEYPTVVFANPDRLIVSHEIAHQWWYGIVGDDQYTEPWLDESFATWSQFLPFGPWRGCARYRWPSSTARLTNDMGYWATHLDEYGVIYAGGGCLLANLAKRFGVQRFIAILRDHAQSHWLGVARGEDFKAAVEAAGAVSLPGFDWTSYWAEWRVG